MTDKSLSDITHIVQGKQITCQCGEPFHRAAVTNEDFTCSHCGDLCYPALADAIEHDKLEFLDDNKEQQRKFKEALKKLGNLENCEWQTPRKFY